MNVADWSDEVAALQDIGTFFHQRTWSVGTSSNYSIVIERDPLRLLLTASGKDKRCLGLDDFVIVDEHGAKADHGHTHEKPSAEAMLHVVAAEQPDVGAVLHTHSVWGTLLSDAFFEAGALEIQGYEMLKGLSGIATHDQTVRIEILDNTSDFAALARTVRERLNASSHPMRHGFLIRRHGLYTWGKDVDEARRHVEILEFLFEVIGRTKQK